MLRPAAAMLILLLAGCGSEMPSGSAPRAPSRPSPASITARPVLSLPPVALASLRGTLVYSAESGATDDVFSVTLPGDEPVRLTDGPEKEFDPALSPDGGRIAFRMNPDPAADDADIWVMRSDGSDRRNLTDAPQDANWAPSWTPDGRIAFTSTRAGSRVLELWTINADGTDPRRVGPGWCEYAQPSPDGSAFVCAAAVGGHYDLVIVDARSGARRMLTTTPTTEFGPAWSADGQWIAFSRDLGARWELLRIRPDGTGEAVVADEGVFPAWDADGHLLWSGPGGIHVANPDGTGDVVLDLPGTFVSWSP
jgi:TolB protein